MELNEQKHKWQSAVLGIEMEMLTFGTGGLPIVLFPTSMGMHNENRDFKLVDSIGWFIESGLIKVYCPDSIDKHSWYNKEASPADRVRNHILYDKMLTDELYPAMRQDTGCDRIGAVGCSFGGYHALNFAFRHPDIVGLMVSLHAKFDITGQLDGYYDDNVYFNNPPDFLPDLDNPNMNKMQIFLGSAEFDMCLDANYQMARMLGEKMIPHMLEVEPGEKHDWPCWRRQLPRFLGLTDFNKINS
ncbi:MAG: alpha/beta hydrolase-fold protein [Chitinophagales bacterium]